jgi:ribose/xylose/arabinose/galactoside ABC-type transport system permease subunit
MPTTTQTGRDPGTAGGPAAGPGTGAALRPRIRLLTRRVLGREGDVRRPVAFLVAAVIIATIITPDFVRPENLNSLLIDSSFLVMLAVGEAFVIMAGSIDLGVESMLAAMGMALAWLTVFHRFPAGLALVVMLIGAALIGLFIGFLVAKVHIPSFVVTLGVYWGFRGIALLTNGGQYISPDSVNPPRQFGFGWLSGTSGGVSNLIIIAFCVVVAGQVVMSLTPFGLRLKSVGSNEQAARRTGLQADRIKMSVFAISAVLAAAAGAMFTAWQGAIYPLGAEGYSLQAIAAVILGGIPFTGGRGTVVGAALGALLIGVINDLIVLFGLPALYQYIFVAVVLVVAGLQARGGQLVK